LLLRVLQRLIRHLFLQEIWNTSTSWHRKCFIRVLQLHHSCLLSIVLLITVFFFLVEMTRSLQKMLHLLLRLHL
jgi:hypothetical protein